MDNTTSSKADLLIEVIQELSLARSIESIQNIVKHAARKIANSDGTCFILRDKDMCYYCDEDSIAPLWKGQRFSMSICVSGWVMLNKKTVVIEDIYNDYRVPIDAYKSTFVKSLVVVPIRSVDPIGAIGNYWQSSYVPTDEEVKLLEALANSTSIAIENVNTYLNLEQQVLERTAQLKTINAELEAFTYSVSHDLRSPLTIIGGLSSMIQQDKENHISPDSLHLFSRIESNCQRMNELINDLLRLSQLSQTNISRQNINISSLAEELLKEQQINNQDRIIVFTVEPGLTVQGDPKLIKILLENLLNNSLKYCSKNQKTIIRVGQFKENDHQGIYIKDNGVGFSVPENREEVFRPFKRFHSAEEYPGSGIGLATVNRIVRLHNGDIWPVSSPNEGATFYFYL
jgi:signal transduction histidine kinase